MPGTWGQENWEVLVQPLQGSQEGEVGWGKCFPSPESPVLPLEVGGHPCLFQKIDTSSLSPQHEPPTAPTIKIYLSPRPSPDKSHWNKLFIKKLFILHLPKVAGKHQGPAGLAGAQKKKKKSSRRKVYGTCRNQKEKTCLQHPEPSFPIPSRLWGKRHLRA